MDPRPRLTLRPHAIDRALEALAALLLVAFVVLVAADWRGLPERVPMHFGFSGEADAWGGRGLVLFLPLLTAAIYVALTLLARYPHVFNYPWPITERNAEEQYRLAVRLLRVVKGVIVLIFLAIYLSIRQTAAGAATGMPPWLLPLMLLAIFGTLGGYLLAASRAARTSS